MIKQNEDFDFSKVKVTHQSLLCVLNIHEADIFFLSKPRNFMIPASRVSTTCHAELCELLSLTSRIPRSAAELIPNSRAIVTADAGNRK